MQVLSFSDDIKFVTMYLLDRQGCLKFGVVYPLFINFGIADLTFIYKMVDFVLILVLST